MLLLSELLNPKISSLRKNLVGKTSLLRYHAKRDSDPAAGNKLEHKEAARLVQINLVPGGICKQTKTEG